MAKKITVIILSILIAAIAAASASVILYFGVNNKAGNSVGPSNTAGTTDGNSSGGTGGSGSTAPPHACSFVFTKTVPAECVNRGYDLFTCTYPGCGKTTQNNFKPATGVHIYETVGHNATCQTDWFQQDECKMCGDVKEGSTVVVSNSKVGHDYAWTEVKKAGCTTEGLMSGKCTWCGAADTKVVLAQGHDFAKYNSNNDMTCTTDGTETAECTRCGVEDTRTAVGSKLGHIYGEYISNNDRTCTKDGTLSAECERCHLKFTIKDEKNLAGHSYGDYVVTSQKTCTQDEISTATCSDCGDKTTKVTAYASHSYSDSWTIVTEPTCQKDGYKTRKCNDCGAVDGVTMDKIDHDFSTGMCPMCGSHLQIDNAMFAVDVKKKDGTVVSDYGEVYLQFVIKSVEKVNTDWGWGYEMDFALYVVQSYKVGGETKTVRTKATLTGTSGRVTVNVLNVKTGQYVEFSGWFDSSIFYDDSRVEFVIHICDGDVYTGEYNVHLEGTFLMGY